MDGEGQSQRESACTMPLSVQRVPGTTDTGALTLQRGPTVLSLGLGPFDPEPGLPAADPPGSSQIPLRPQTAPDMWHLCSWDHKHEILLSQRDLLT